tara:strand:+ start:262 stop:927 length:666 start_codon:yes stop_codon:yes gene_type:complete
MFKKKKFQKLTSRYNEHAYTGLMGYFMKKCHQDLENFSFKKKIQKVLEIGAGNAPHYKFIKHPYERYYIIETTKIKKKYYKDNSKVIAKKYDGKKIPFKNNFFDRIIISHCLEHINYPEEFIFEMLKKLKKGGILSISLPTDPGLLFRIGRTYLKLFSIKNKYKIDEIDFDYMNATEHVNSIFGLSSIIKYNFKEKVKESFVPFKIRSFDLNLFYNVHIIK